MGLAERSEARLIEAKYPGSCLTCEERIEAGTNAYWVPGVGMWHEDCDVPRNLQQYVKQSQASKTSPLSTGSIFE